MERVLTFGRGGPGPRWLAQAQEGPNQVEVEGGHLFSKDLQAQDKGVRDKPARQAWVWESSQGRVSCMPEVALQL